MISLKQWIHDIKGFIQYGDLPTSYFVKRGMKVGKNFNRQSGTRLDPTNCWLIEIGDDVIMGNKSQIIAHDFSSMHHTGFVHSFLVSRRTGARWYLQTSHRWCSRCTSMSYCAW